MLGQGYEDKCGNHVISVSLEWQPVKFLKEECSTVCLLPMEENTWHDVEPFEVCPVDREINE